MPKAGTVTSFLVTTVFQAPKETRKERLALKKGIEGREGKGKVSYMTTLAHALKFRC